MGSLEYAIIFIAILTILKLHLSFSLTGVCRSKRLMEGKTVIVTGANSGIGLETARDLAQRKARVILACRNLEKGMQAVEDIKLSTMNNDVEVRHLDLSSLASVRKFAAEINATEQQLDVLVHNAGVVPTPGKHLTADNLELQFATNHFGPFLLTHLLLNLLKRSAPSRIIVVSSSFHWLGVLDLENLNCEKYQRSPLWIYCSTKLANILFTRELSDRLSGSGVTVNALHPGAVMTNIARNASWFDKFVVGPVIKPLLSSAKKGAQTSIYLSVSEEVEGVSGQYFARCQPAWASPFAKSKKLAKELWAKSERVTGIRLQ